MSKRRRKARRLAQRKKVQKRFKARVAAGKSGLTGGKKGDKKKGTTTIGNYRQAQRQQVQDAARQRNETFKINRATKNLDTNAMVARDNRMYGNTFPSGSIGISDAGRRQAAANRASAARAKSAAEARRKSAENARRIAAERAAAEAARKAEAERKRKAEIARKAEEKRQRMFNPERLRQTFDVANIMSPGGDMASWYNTGADPTKSFKQVLGDEISMSQRTQGVGKGAWNPARGMPGYGSIRNILTGKPFNTKFEGGFESGPTEANRRLFNNLGKVAIGTALFNQGKTGSLTDKVVSNTPNVNVGGLSIGFKSPESTDLGARASRFVTDTIGKIAGGLNIGGASAQASEGGEGETSTRTSRAIGPKSIAALGADVISQAFAPRLADGTLTGNTDFAGRTPGTEGFDNRDVQIKQAVNNAMNSRFVQQAGENLGLPKNFKAQTKNAMDALGENFKGATADRGGIYKGISETAKNLTQDPRLAPLAGYVNQISTDNPNVSDAERSNRFKIAGINTPFTNETVADIVSGFQPNAKKFTGLSTKERGVIEGGAGNRIVSGKLTDIAREALVGDIGTGSTLGLAKGTPLSLANMVGAAGAIQKNLKDSGTLASKRTAEIGRLAGGKGDITTPSLIRGTLPRFGGGRRSGTPVSMFGGGSTTTATPTVTPVQQVTEELLPIQQQQSGQDPTALADIAQQAYTSALNSYGIDPNFFARINRRRFNTQPNSFRRSFIRRYFA